MKPITVKSFKKKNIDSDYVDTLSCILNPEDNGGEAVIMEVDVFKNSDGYHYTNMRFEMQCGGTGTAQMLFANGITLEALGKACRQMQLLIEDKDQLIEEE